MDTHIYKPSSYPLDLIGPITILWKAQVNTIKPVTPTSSKGKEKAHDIPDDNLRTIWIISHPAIFEQVFETLQACSSTALDAVAKAGGPEVDVEIGDLREQVDIFEIMGPKSSQIIKGALTPVSQDGDEEFTKVCVDLISGLDITKVCRIVQFWSSLNDLKTTASIPRGMVVGFKVVDPRLK